MIWSVAVYICINSEQMYMHSHSLNVGDKSGEVLEESSRAVFACRVPGGANALEV